MNKRQFLQSAALGAAALPVVPAFAAPVRGGQGGALLTISGLIGKPNRGALDPQLDQLFIKHKVSFDKAMALDAAAIAALPAATIKVTLEYDGKMHAMRGPRLLDVLRLAGAPSADNTQVFLRALDGYTVAPSLADLRKYRFIVATHMDDRPLAMGGLGPLFVIYEADRFPEMAAKPLNERFGLCPWGCYHVDVKAA